MAASTDTSRISPTAHYTSYVWYAHGLSYGALTTRTGHTMYRALRPVNALFERAVGRPNLERMLLARHQVIDRLLEEQIRARTVEQVIEVAAGLSPRGVRLATRYPELVYVEGDLPRMASQKRRMLDEAGLRRDGHHVVALNALLDEGEASLGGVSSALLDPSKGTAIITEGLVNYFKRSQVESMFQRFANCLRAFPRGIYLSDVITAGDAAKIRSVKLFRHAVSLFARGSVHFHFVDALEGETTLRLAGFEGAELHRPDEFEGITEPEERQIVRILKATRGL